MPELKICTRCASLHDEQGPRCVRCPEQRRGLSRDPAARAIYDSWRWRKLRAAKVAEVGACQRCGLSVNLSVHHDLPISSGYDPYDPDNLVVLCRKCHNKTDARRRRGGGYA